MNSLYEKATVGIETVLRHRYKMTASDAKEAIRTSPLKSVFEHDPEMAAHTSNEAWARDIHKYWIQNKITTNITI